MQSERFSLERLSLAAREASILAPYAMHSADSAGRHYAEPPHPYRGPFQRDRDRILHSSAYRRLSAKTQVFTDTPGDYHRTRLTHTLEVSSVARTLGRALALNEDLTEALALVHDLGHPPFGHAGEDALDACMAQDGGFCHNRQALRIVEELEVRYPDFPGLNLSWEVLAGQQYRANKRAATERPLLEAQVVDAADSIAYDAHDADDALELGLLSLDELLAVPLWAEAARRVRSAHTRLAPDELRRAILHELIDWQVSDLLRQAAQRLTEFGAESTAAIHQAPAILVFSNELGEQKRELETFLHQRVYRHPDVVRRRDLAQQRLRELFQRLQASPELLPPRYRQRAATTGLPRAVADYVAGMTDRFVERTIGAAQTDRPDEDLKS